MSVYREHDTGCLRFFATVSTGWFVSLSSFVIAVQSLVRPGAFHYCVYVCVQHCSLHCWQRCQHRTQPFLERTSICPVRRLEFRHPCTYSSQTRVPLNQCMCVRGCMCVLVRYATQGTNLMLVLSLCLAFCWHGDKCSPNEITAKTKLSLLFRFSLSFPYLPLLPASPQSPTSPTSIFLHLNTCVFFFSNSRLAFSVLDQAFKNETQLGCMKNS